jgi:xanthine dehydrogenase C subunit
MTFSEEFIAVAPSVWEPDSVEAAWRLFQKMGSNSRFVAGATWLRTQWESGISPMPHHIISITSISEMTRIQKLDNWISIGAGATLQDCRKNKILQAEFPHLIEALRSIAAPSIRNMATLGGNVLTAVGDSIPALLVIGAELCWFDGENRSTESLVSWLLARSKDSFQIEQRILLSVRLPLLVDMSNEPGKQISGRCLTYYHKVGRREAFTPSLITAAYQGRVNADGNLCDFRIAIGGGAAAGMRLTLSECLLNDNRYSAALLQKLQQVIREQMVTYSDAFASAQYRKNTAANLICAALWKALEVSI